MAGYKPTTSKYVGKTKTIYVVYKETHIHNYRGHRKKRTQTRVKRVYVSGKLVKISKRPRWLKNKFGRKVWGLEVIYENPVSGAKVKPYTAHRGKTVYHVKGKKLPKRKALVRKVVELPKSAKSIRITTKPPKKPLMDIE